MSERKALTVGELSRQLGIPIHRVEYLIRSRNICPEQRAGCARVFTQQDLCRLRQELETQTGSDRVG